MQKAMSVVEVTKPGTYNGGVPIKGGLNDPALGANDPRSTCATCKNTYTGSGKINECPGHFGHIEVRQRPLLAHFAAANHDKQSD